jgi:dihydrofolate reductase
MPVKPPAKARALKKRGSRAAKRLIARDRPSSGRVHLYAGISLDGYLAAPDGGVDWLNPYADARAGFAPFIKTIGCAIMGRATYDFAVAHGYGSFGEMPSYVVTHRPFPPPSPSVIPFSGDLAGLIRQIRRRHPRDIWLMGGGKLTKSFQEADLIDIWSVAFVPTFLGAGLPMFPPSAFSERRVRLVSTRKYPSGVIELRYERGDASRRRPKAALPVT